MSCPFNQALGLHWRDYRKHLVYGPKFDYIDEQCRKRKLWVVYAPNKYLGAIFGRPKRYHDQNIDQDFLAVLNDEEMSNTGPRSELAEDCHIEFLVCYA